MKQVRGLAKGMTQVVRYAQSHHWHAERTRGGHLKLTKRGCPPVFASCTPSDDRAKRNVLAQLKRAERTQLQRRAG